MRQSKVLSKIRAGKVARICCMGHYLPFFIRHSAHFGYDGIWVDAEHRAFHPREIQALLAFHHLADIDCIWRAATLEKTGLYRLLEDGAAGLMIPHVSTPEKARQLVEATKFPPLGDRGMDGAGLDADFMVNLTPAYREAANRETFLAVQIETPQALDNLDAIAAVPGVDVLMMGPGDLSIRLGFKPSLDDPAFAAAQKRTAQAAVKHGKAWGRPCFGVEDARRLIEAGAQFVIMGSDFMGVYSHLKESAAHLDSILKERPPVTGAPVTVAIP